MKILMTLLVAASTIFGNSHDITTLGQWGPYSKQYSGISHISELQSGCMVDFTLMPGFYRRTVCVPDVLFENENGCYPWRFSPDLSSWTYRYEIEWKDRVYVDATYHVLDQGRVLLEMHCVNATEQPQDLLLHTMASIRHAEEYPQAATDSPFVRAMSYESYEPAVKTHAYALVYDGWLRGEKRDPQSLTGSVLTLSGKAGDSASWQLPEGHQAQMLMRAMAPAGAQITIALNGTEVTVHGSGSYELIPFSATGRELSLTSLSDGALTIDAFLLAPDAEVRARDLSITPELTTSDRWYSVKYEDDPSYYGVASNYPLMEINQYVNSDMDVFLRRMVHRHNQNYFPGDGKGHFTSAFQRPVSLKAQSDTTIYNLIVCGSEERVTNELFSFRHNEKKLIAMVRKAPAETDGLLPGAEKYALGSQIIQANLFNNIVYPVWTQGQYIRHFTPGKNWNSLYTWDSGFIAWALSELDPVKAAENIRAYTTEEGSQSAFIHHGTPLPIQFMAFKHLYDKTGDEALMEFMYPRLKRFYDFMTGNDGLSTTRMADGLLRTWDYFYNSGGWDDYPPQHELRSRTHLYATMTPMVQTSFYIRAARILRLYARHMGLKADEKAFDKDIERMTAAIQDSAWDPEAGYFGYVNHDAEGRPAGIYRWRDGKTDFNMGLDGVSPLVAGICTPEQRDIITDHIFDPARLWTPVGISTVDQSAPYYTLDGYWNGCVWMPHQFILWKTMLDLGRADLAEKIAYTALDTWSYETGISYRSFEHFMVESKRGKGWHDFSGLSTPVVNWFASYYRQGTVTTGFDLMLSHACMSEDHLSYQATIESDKTSSGEKVIILCMAPGHTYKATLDGRPAKLQSPRDGLVYVTVSSGRKNAVLKVFSE